FTTDSLATERLTRAELAAAERNQAKPAARVASTRKPTLRRRVGRRPYSYLATIGVAGLVVGGLVGFGATYLSGAGLHAAGSTEAIKLPAKLSGGFARSKTADPQLQTSISSARKTLGAGTDMALYTKGQTDVLVQATRLPGQAILQAGLKYAHVGKAVCASGTAASSPEAVCTRTDGGLTVQVSATDSKTAAKYVEEVYAKLA
ncbi:MAG: hypothetical protein J2O46_10205, partial [Nocardioides sp.]|nr:hypothetical protein [Nocardioides sp.]